MPYTTLARLAFVIHLFYGPIVSLIISEGRHLFEAFLEINSTFFSGLSDFVLWLHGNKLRWELFFYRRIGFAKQVRKQIFLRTLFYQFIATLRILVENLQIDSYFIFKHYGVSEWSIKLPIACYIKCIADDFIVVATV